MKRLLLPWLFFPLVTFGQLSRNNPYDTISTTSPPVRETKQLIKAGIGLPLFRHSSITTAWKVVGVDVIMERKLKQGFTFVGGLETNYSFNPGLQMFSVEMPLAIRYYFPIEKKTSQRSFNPYLAFHTQNVLFANLRYDSESGRGLLLSTYYRGQFLTQRTNVGIVNEGFNMIQYGFFQAGIQLKIASSNYLDINAAIPISMLTFHKSEYALSFPAYINLKYGIFW